MAYINTENLFKCETCRRYRGEKCLAWCESYECYAPSMKKIPTEDVVEVKHSEWHKVRELAPRYVCSCCNHLYNNMGYKYCPNCGAKMDGKALKEREKE